MSSGEKRTAVVLAASRGLGRACAEALAKSGWNLFICSRDPDGVRETVRALRNLGAAAEGIDADVSSRAGIEKVFSGVDRAFGRLDALICNAGGPPPGDFVSLSEDHWRSGFELTLMSAVRSIEQAIPRMKTGGYGRIIVLGSSSVRRPIPNLVLSNAFRPALAGIVKSLAVELGAIGITVNMVSPGRLDTARVRELDAKTADLRGISVATVRSDSEASIPMGRYGRPEELADAVTFLVSERAAYLTGQSLLIDGGMVPTLP